MKDNENQATADPAAGAVSRRDFLRRAGKEAAETGVRIVPGAQIARAALGDARSGQPNWWQRILHWRQDRTPGSPIAEDDNA